MEIFVNREAELTFIEEAFNALLDERRILRTPIIEFYGVEGIGKTRLLQEVKAYCIEKQVSYFWATARQDQSWLSEDMIITAKKTLQREPLVLLLDALDVANDADLERLQELLHDLVKHTNLCVILASRRILTFEGIRSVTRKLRLFELKPLTKNDSHILIGKNGLASDSEYELIFEWTHGYPLALSVMVQAILSADLDPSREQDQQKLLFILTEEVIDKRVLSRVAAADLAQYRTLISLLSVPRRFNLSLMSEIIEHYAKEYTLSSIIGYIGLPKKINSVADILVWDPIHTGYAVNDAVRSIFLVKLKIEQPEFYRSIHRFLAEVNHRFALEVVGIDRLYYLREYFYHLASSEDEPAHLLQTFENVISHLVQGESPGYFPQFYEEFAHDEELKKILGEEVMDNILKFLYRSSAHSNRKRVEESSGSERMRYMQDFLHYAAHNSLVWRDMSDNAISNYAKELLESTFLQKALGTDYDILLPILRSYISSEG